MAAGGAETHFAKILASNEKTVRDRAIKKLRIWISTRRSGLTGLSETDMLKLWKGLFYCMWMSDKPKVQEELAETISQLLHSFHSTSSALDFLDGFFKTMCREWHGIDRLRLDKFYLLMRKFIYQSLVFLKNHNWNDKTVSLLNKTLENGVLASCNKSAPDGVRIHVIQVYLDELIKLDASKIPSAVLVTLVEPFVDLLATTKSKVITSSLSHSIFDSLLDVFEKEEENSRLNVNYNTLAEQFFSRASRQDIPGRNRNILYDYIKKFKNASNREMNRENKYSKNEELLNGADNPINKRINADGDADESLDSNTINDEEMTVKEKSATETVSNKLAGIANQHGHVRKTKKENKKGEKKRKCEDVAECSKNVNELNNSEPEKGVCCEMSKRSKRRKLDENDNTIELCEPKQEASKKSGKEKKKKKKKKSDAVSVAVAGDLMNVAPRENLQKDVDDMELRFEENEDLDGSYLGTIPLPKRKLRSADAKRSTIEKMKSENLDQSDGTAEKSTLDETWVSASGTAVSKENQLDSKRESKSVPETASSPPLAMFLSHSLRKSRVNTEQRHKKEGHSVHSKVNSAPENRRKQVRIELSKNTSHTTQDYRRSLKFSPSVPFDAAKKPVQSSLKTPPSKRSPSLTTNRSSAADFFKKK